ncbi:prolyl oligopeptidase family serine peptidase [Chelatococcus reniformis]|uniref:prolyl oligopeptidase n=1 Tax=Chelatococcus reniformis TaxID=1494448 RepID=A0A916UTA6_9HYPH|nr:prolyl oligopeptidase family serine peptidase [Chelatococcus reniformis]GGC85869.1 prolyl endopeptidase [Chelatococcus reniformis]
MPALAYPKTRRVDVVDAYFGMTVADPYRWLESDAARDADVAAWVAAQNTVTADYLATLPGREVLRNRLTALFDHEQVTAPHKRGTRLFHARNPGLKNQPILFVREGVDGEDRVLIDPNAWSADGATALAEWAASKDGTHVAYAVQEGGTDWRTIRVLHVESGTVLDDRVEWARFTGISWVKDGSGFFYSRFPARQPGAASTAGISGHAVYFHALGTAQAEDRLVHATPDHLGLLHVVEVTDDGRYALIYSTPGATQNALSLVDLASQDWAPRALIENFDNQWALLGNTDETLFLITDRDAGRGKIVALDLAGEAPAFTDVVAEQEGVLNQGKLLGGELVLAYLLDAKTDLQRFERDGTPAGAIELPGIGAAGGLRGDPDDDEMFYVFTSFNAPTTVYRHDLATGESSIWAAPRVNVDLDALIVDQRFYPSKDGTAVPMFIVRRRDVTGPAPTLLYGYGGFSISLFPFYSPAQVAWIEQGGVLAIANLRGGGEYGREWHDAGRLQNKQNVFDDFIAAGEFLKAEGVTRPDGLAIQGESNGGLLVGAVVNQRPDLFAAALPGVGVMDMLRFNRFTGGQLWTSDYGDPANEADVGNLLTYSPYHNIRPGQDYPAILATTADTDDRVVPGHTFKYIAAVQAADVGPRPHLVRIESRAGHGAGKPTDKIIAELTDLLAFAARWTGLEVEAKA